MNQRKGVPAPSNRELLRGYEAISKSLREFGYPDVNMEMIEEIHRAMQHGRREHDLPHGSIGMFAQSQILEHPDIFGVKDE